MKTIGAVTALSALAQEARLKVFRLLVQAGPEGMAASKIAERLGLPPSTLSFHLKELSHAALIEARQEGRYIIYCGSAAGEECPACLGPVLRTHWGVGDPAHATGTDEGIDAAFMHAYRTLRKRIETFLALPLEELKNDRQRMKAELDRIGQVQA